jgi:hypothetical protein
VTRVTTAVGRNPPGTPASTGKPSAKGYGVIFVTPCNRAIPLLIPKNRDF